MPVSGRESPNQNNQLGGLTVQKHDLQICLFELREWLHFNHIFYWANARRFNSKVSLLSAAAFS
jgi:hypothetical protein